MNGTPLDLRLDGFEGAVSAWLVDGEEPALVDPGPSTTLPALEAALEARGAALDDVRHLLVTHIHLDHAGGVGHLVERLPRAVVHVHEEGAPHLVHPRRLVASTRRSFGEHHDRLWGEVRPVPLDRVRVWRPGERGPLQRVRAIPTPGHIGHHLAYLDEGDGTLYAGDALGIGLSPESPVHPPTPPPSVDLPAWYRTLDVIGEVGPERAAVAHFGLHHDPVPRAERLGARLRALEARVRTALAEGRTEDDEAAYAEEVRREQAASRPRAWIDRYFDTFPAVADYRGVVHHLERSPGSEAP